MMTPATIAPHIGSDLPVLIHRIDDATAEVRCTIPDVLSIARARLRGAGYECRPIVEGPGVMHRFRVVGWKRQGPCAEYPGKTCTYCPPKCGPCSGSGKAHSIFDDCACEPECDGLGVCGACGGKGVR